MPRGLQIAGARTLLTGASGGIGHALAQRLAAEGAELTLSGRRPEVLEALAAPLGARVVACDLTEADAVPRLLAAAGEIDILVANAALPGTGRLVNLEPRHIDRALAVNLRAPIALAHGVLPAMLEHGSGHLVFIGSLSGRAATAGSSIYNATKFGLRGFALALRAELAGSGVGVSLVEPGFIADAGMYADTAIKLPRGIGTRPPSAVAAAVVRAITHDRGELSVAPPLQRFGAVFASLAPEFAARAGRLGGAEQLAEQFEARQAEKR
jgi:short-subunit dehydrogenase